MLVGSLGSRNAGETPEHATQLYNSGSLVSPAGEWVGRYDKMHLVPFGEYVPFKRVFGFAGGLTQEVGDFSPGTSRAPLQAGGKLGVFICYESIFPDEIRQLAANGAAGVREYIQRRLVRRQRSLCPAPEAGPHARRRK